MTIQTTPRKRSPDLNPRFNNTPRVYLSSKIDAVIDNLELLRSKPDLRADLKRHNAAQTKTF